MGKHSKKNLRRQFRASQSNPQPAAQSTPTHHPPPHSPTPTPTTINQPTPTAQNNPLLTPISQITLPNPLVVAAYIFNLTRLRLEASVELHSAIARSARGEQGYTVKVTGSLIRYSNELYNSAIRDFTDAYDQFARYKDEEDEKEARKNEPPTQPDPDALCQTPEFSPPNEDPNPLNFDDLDSYDPDSEYAKLLAREKNRIETESKQLAEFQRQRELCEKRAEEEGADPLEWTGWKERLQWYKTGAITPDPKEADPKELTPKEEETPEKT